MKIKNIINNFSNKKIAVIGDIILDNYTFGKVKRISPEAPVPVVEKTREFHRQGGAANVALNIESLEAEASLISVIGDDKTGKLLKKLIKNNSQLFIEKGRITSFKSRVIASNQQLLRLDHEKKENINSSIENKILNILKKTSFDLIIISDYAKGIITRRLLTEIKKIAKKKNINLVVDPKLINKNYYKGVSGLVPNIKEAKELTGYVSEDKKVILKELKNQYSLDWAIITLGDKGMCGINKINEYFEFTAINHEVFDVTGAGDTVVAVLGLSLASGASLKQAAFISNIAASVVVTKLGAASSSQEEILNIYNSRYSKKNKLE